MDYKRPKIIKSRTETIKLDCGNLQLIEGFQEEVDGKIIEVRPVIGKNGVCGQVLLDTCGKLMSIILQSSKIPKYKIVKKFKKQFVGVQCSHGKSCCVDTIAKKVIEQLEA